MNETNDQLCIRVARDYLLEALETLKRCENESGLVAAKNNISTLVEWLQGEYTARLPRVAAIKADDYPDIEPPDDDDPHGITARNKWADEEYGLDDGTG